jgi:hypothetical protein
VQEDLPHPVAVEQLRELPERCLPELGDLEREQGARAARREQVPDAEQGHAQPLREELVEAADAGTVAVPMVRDDRVDRH